MKRLLIFVLHFVLLINQAKAQNFEMETIRRATFEGRGINIVFMGSGYTAQQQDQFLVDVRRFSDGLFAEPPFSLYANYFNVYAIKVETEANDHDGYFDHGLSASGLLTVSTNTVNNIRNAHFPQNLDRVFVAVLVNTEVGAANAIPNRLLIRHNGSVKVFAHEMGHAFARVTDEYWTGTGQNANKATVVTPIETLSWKRWIGESDNNVDGNGNATFVGRYSYFNGTDAESNLWERPSQQCLMRFIENRHRFCSVCSQEIISRVHELVASVGNKLPALNVVNNVRNFSLQNVFAPNPSTLTYDWYINDNPIIGAFGSSVEITIAAFGGAGQHVVKAVVRDATPRVRLNVGAEFDGVTLSTHQWTVNISQQYYNQQIVVLPIELKNFTVKAEPNGVSLIWNILTEKDNDRFVIEKSVDGKSFKLLTTVPGNGTTNQPKSYVFFDDMPFSGISYYRLTQVDANGATNILGNRSVNFSLPSEKYTLYPNPADDHIYWKTCDKGKEEMEFTLTDITGRVIYNKVEKTSSSVIMIKPSVKPKPGMYTLKVKEGNAAAQYIKVLFQ